jgi:hypothetical protein
VVSRSAEHEAGHWDTKEKRKRIDSRPGRAFKLRTCVLSLLELYFFYCQFTVWVMLKNIKFKKQHMV